MVVRSPEGSSTEVTRFPPSRAIVHLAPAGLTIDEASPLDV